MSRSQATLAASPTIPYVWCIPLFLRASALLLFISSCNQVGFLTIINAKIKTGDL